MNELLAKIEASDHQIFNSGFNYVKIPMEKEQFYHDSEEILASKGRVFFNRLRTESRYIQSAPWSNNI